MFIFFSLLCYLFISVFLDSCRFESPIHFLTFLLFYFCFVFFFLLIFFFSSTTFFFISFLSCCLFYFYFLHPLPPCIVLLHLLSSGFLLPVYLLSNKIVPSSVCCCVFVSVMKIVWCGHFKLDVEGVSTDIVDLQYTHIHAHLLFLPRFSLLSAVYVNIRTANVFGCFLVYFLFYSAVFYNSVELCIHLLW